MKWRVFAVTFLVLLSAFEIVAEAVDVAGVRGHFGWQFATTDPLLVSHVFQGEPADKGGIRAGDRIDLGRLYPNRTRYFDPIISFQAMPGTRVQIPLIRGTQHLTATVTVGGTPSEPVYQDFAFWFGSLTSLAVIVLCAWIVLRKSNAMTWSLFAFAVGLSNGTTLTLARFGYWAMLASGVVSALLSTGPFLIVFAARVPNDASSAWRTWFSRAAIALFCVAAGTSLYPIVAWSILGLPQQYVDPPSWILAGFYPVTGGLTIIALVLSLAVARGEDRHRMNWIGLGIVIWIGSSTLLLFIPSITYTFALFSFVSVLSCLGLIAIAYGIVKGRIVDVSFVISRAIVAASLAAGVVAVFAVLDWIVSKRLEATRVGTFTEIALAIALGFWFNGLHKKVDVFVDRLFFRKRYAAEQRLNRASHAVPHATTLEAVREFLVDEPLAAMDLASAALFEQADDRTWQRTKALGWDEGTLTELKTDDALMLHIQAEQIALRTTHIRWPVNALPAGHGRPVFAVPVLARRHVVAVALYGQHCSGADLDTDELRALEKVTDASGAAFDHVEAEALRKRNADLERRMRELTAPAS